MSVAATRRAEPAPRDLRPLVLLALGGLICLVHLWQWRRPARPSPPHRYLWLAGGSLAEGLYLLPAAATTADLYRAAGLAAPSGLPAALPASGAELTLRDGGAPATGPMTNPLRPLFFQAIAVNHADRELLVTVPGIGPALADRIVRHREQNGPYLRPEGLLAVAGIGPRLLDRFRPYLEFSP